VSSSRLAIVLLRLKLCQEIGKWLSRKTTPHPEIRGAGAVAPLTL
jgi:hypothetical protein